MSGRPATTALDIDLCDAWIDAADHRCTSYARHQIILKREI